MLIDPKKIEEWKALAENASQSPWRVGEYGSGDVDDASGEQVAHDGHDMSDGAFRRDADRDFVIAARDAVPALLSEREEMLALLREVEWNGAAYDDGADGDVGHCCPVCGVSKLDSPAPVHAPDCRLAAFLRRSE